MKLKFNKNKIQIKIKIKNLFLLKLPYLKKFKMREKNLYKTYKIKTCKENNLIKKERENIILIWMIQKQKTIFNQDKMELFKLKETKMLQDYNKTKIIIIKTMEKIITKKIKIIIITTINHF